MKHIHLLLLTTLVMLGAAACGQAGKNTEKAAEKEVNTIHLTKAGFLSKIADYESNSAEWKYLGDKPAVVDFHASWCGPCKMIAPILEELAAQYANDIYIYKIDIDAEQELASVFSIRSIPTLLFIPMNDSPQIMQGAMSKDRLEKIIQDVLLENQQP
jgi:thioredoxin